MDTPDPSTPRRGGMRYRIMFFLGLILLFVGLDLIILLSKLSRITGVAPLLIGMALVWYSSGKRYPDDARGVEGIDPGDRYRQAWFLRRISFNGRAVPYMWVAGLLLAFLDIGYNLLLDQKHTFASFDFVVLAIAGAFFMYRFIPLDAAKERDFTLVLLVCLFGILILPTLMVGMFTDEPVNETNSPLVRVFLVQPMIMVLDHIGIWTESSGAVIRYQMQDGGPPGEVAIALSCSGIYSLSLFISGFVSYLVVERKRFALAESLFLVSGVLIAYLGNLVRMISIVAIGSFYGQHAFLQAHAYLGELIFILWIIPFWGILFAVMWKLDARSERADPERGG